MPPSPPPPPRPLHPPPPLKGVVIITLPPPDDPSQAKTITAFTLTPPPETLNPSAASPPSPPPPPASRRRPVVGSARRLRRAALWLAVAAAVVALAWACTSSEASLDLLRAMGVVEEEGKERRDGERGSFVFQLYRKGGEGRRRVLREEEEMEVEGFRRRRRDVVRVATAGMNESSVAFPVRGDVFPNGMYYTILRLGNPPRPYYLDMDTGSDLTWTQCDAPCTSCAKGPNPLYKPTAGKLVPSWDSYCTDVQNGLNIEHCESCRQCDYEIEYSDHSSSMGVLVKDELPLKMTNKEIAQPTLVFGCAYDQQGQLSASPAYTDGILGLSSAKVGLPSQLADQDIITNVVGHCISQRVNAGGYMFLGDDFVPRWGMTWVTMLSTPRKHYEVKAQKISYGEEQIETVNNMGTVVFDSGSSYSYFTNDAYSGLISSIMDGLEGLVQDESDLTLPVCWKADFPIRSIEEVKQIFKPVTLHFENSWVILSRTYIIPPEGYLVINDKGNVCLGILNGTDVGVTNILGDISLQGQLVVYDNIRGNIGWVRSDCMKPERKTPFPFLF